MFAIHEVTLNNFKSYQGEHTFTLPTEPGLYSLTGENRVNPRLERNATGKSTVLDAICWGLYGRTAAGGRGGAVLCRQARGVAGVSIKLTSGLCRGVVSRSYGPSTLTFDGQPIDQPDLDKKLRLSYDEFVSSVMLPQSCTFFFDKGPTEKLSLFSKIMDLDYWVGKSDEAKSDTEAIIADITLVTEQLAGSDGRITELTNFISSLTEKKDTYESTRLEELKKLQAEVLGIDKELRANAGALPALSKKEKDAEEAVAAYKLIKAENTKLRMKLDVAEGEHSRLHKLVEAGICPTCEQKISGFGKRLDELTDDAGALREKILENDQKLAAASKCESTLAGIRKNITDFELSASRLQYRKDGLEKQISRTSENPFVDELIRVQGKLKAETKKNSKLKAELHELDGLKTATKFWIDGFKRIRLLLVEAAIKQLEIEVNNNLAGLGMPDWRVQFDIERENKSGSVTRGFSVQVFAPNVEGAIPLESWSGGEGQRIKLAGNLGIANLIMERAGLVNTLELYDEPSAHLSGAGQLELAELLDERARSTNRIILLVDHNTIDYGGFRGRATVYRDTSGSHLEWE